LLTGIININKPPNVTSHDVVNQLRKILNIKKIGHTGTLDPLATGVLPLCIGKATRLIQYLPTDKQYIAEITLGITTSSYDSDGEITSKQKATTDRNQILETLNSFNGEIIQEVPLTSATHYKGKKLYQYAHKGIEITDLPTKKVQIYNIELINIQKEDEDNPIITIKVDCGSGTYIRSIANDLGKKLLCGAYLSKLIRTIASGLKIEDSITIEELKTYAASNQLKSVVISPTKVIELPKVKLTLDQIKIISKGQFLSIENLIFNDNKPLLLLDSVNEVAAIGKFDQTTSTIKPITVLT
jgi:tRNA pseudouridine55 synthase